MQFQAAKIGLPSNHISNATHEHMKENNESTPPSPLLWLEGLSIIDSTSATTLTSNDHSPLASSTSSSPLLQLKGLVINLLAS
jgi:hypothetical protein